MLRIFGNEFFDVLTIDEKKQWIKNHYNQLIGSAIFTKNNSITSKVVRWAENWGEKDKDKFTPSHTGSIIEYNNDIYIFDMKPLRASVQPLIDYLCNTKDEYRIVLRNFELDTFMFSKNIAYHIGQWYPYMSAIRSVFTKRSSKWQTHCSELHAVELQKQNIYLSINPEITPDELYYIMT